eukprot:CAMPEP_0175039452 /NCGR_PEP_ID=MMETSP0052_2-20121109/591_1 /TAXON_ID=51329 ORGANISM="Polytomella parva, Strain SAG 63-3" /NCGR_SAMPLE_ID=MMETSP0052_2 /ASSEMBLY_ACC=CAM_ASM_000194 /LENGTH=425 /DNA_ID=CAMNT_0016301305 /DNA_START=23 /DNA_END=1301 /DNA_ORIENTATION=-
MVLIEDVSEIPPMAEGPLDEGIPYYPERCVKVTEDGGVVLEVLEEGEGERPCLHAQCLVHYIGRLMETGSVFLDTLEEAEGHQPAMVVAGRTTAPRDVGLCLAVSMMRPGGHARVHILDPKYGYGETGSFSFPSVPGNSTLSYDVRLLHWEAPSEDEDNRGGLLYEERLERAERRRIAGNELFRNGEYRSAMGKYSMALTYLDEEFFYQLEGKYLSRAEESKASVHLNLAACQIKLGDFHTCIYNCTQALALGDPEFDPEKKSFRVKALYRRALARRKLMQSQDAMKDLEEAFKLEPRNAGVLEELKLVRAVLKDEREASAAMFKGKLPKNTAASSSFSSASGPGGEVMERKGEKEAGIGINPNLKAAVQAASEAEKRMKEKSTQKAGLLGLVSTFIAFFQWLARVLFSPVPVLKKKPVQDSKSL